MEAGLDNLMTTLETDCGITSDGIPILSHDPHIQGAEMQPHRWRALRGCGGRSPY